MLGSLDNTVQAGINFTANLQAVERTKKRLSSLKRDVELTAGAFLPLAEGSDSASRSLGRMTGASSGASAGLAGLQSQIVSTRVAQESLNNQTGDLRSSLRELRSSTEGWSIGDSLNAEQDKILDAAAKSLDDAQFNKMLADMGDDEALQIDDDVINSIEDYRKVVNKVTGSGDGFTDDDREVGLPNIKPTQEFRNELEKIEGHTNNIGHDQLWQNLFRPIGADKTPTPADTTSPMFPGGSEFDTHVFHDLFESGDFTDVDQIVEGVKSGDTDLSEILSVGPSMQEKETNIFDLFPDGSVPKHREGGDRRLFSTLPDQLQEDMLDNLNQADLTSLDDIFTASDVDLNNAFIDGVGDQDYSLDADSVREEVLKDLRNAYPVPESDQFYDDLAKDLDNMEIPLGELDGSRKLDAQSEILRGRQEKFGASADDTPATLMRAVDDDVAEILSSNNIESVGDVADADIGILNRLPDFGPERSEKLKYHAQHLQRSINSLDKGVADGLIDLMSENEEIMDTILHSSSFDDAIDAFQELDSDGLARLDTLLEQNSEEILEGVISPQQVFEQIDATSTRDDIHQQLRQTDGIKESLNDRQIEMLTGMMDDLGGGSDDVQRPQNLSREVLGFRTMQEMMDTDPSEEPDRSRSLRGIMQTIYDPKTGFPTTLFDDDSAMKGEFYPDLRDTLPSNMVTSGAFDEGEGPDIARDITRTLMDTSEGVGVEDFFGEDSMSIGDVFSSSDYIDHFQFDDPNVLDRATSGTEELLPQFAGLHAARVAPGMQNAARRQGDMSGVQEMLPGQNILGFDTSQDNASQLLDKEFNQYFKSLDQNLGDLRQVQRSSPILQGGALSGVLTDDSGRERPRGVFGRLTGVLSETQRYGSPRDFKRLQRRMDGVVNGYQDMLPLLQATSIRLGSVNVNFESMGIMLFKLTAMIGPVVASLMGLATAAAASAAALGGLVAVGAVEYLGEMEDTMAGINNKQEAMAEIGDVLTDMAWEAVMPLRQARIGGDGMRGYEAFIGALRGGLQILNRVANIMAYIVELEVVGNELERITEFLLNPTGDQQLAENLGEVVTEVLPLINDALIGLMGSFGNMTDFVSSLTAALGDRLLKVVEDIVPVLALITAYGAGFFDAALFAVGVVASLVNAVFGLVDVLTGALNVLPGVSVESRRLMYWMGALIGVMNVVSRVATFLAAKKALLIAVSGGLSTAYGILTASTWSLAAATKALALSLVLVTASLVAIYEGFSVLSDVQIGEDGWISSAVYGLGLISAGLGTIAFAFRHVLGQLISFRSLLWGLRVAGTLAFKGIVWGIKAAVGAAAGFLTVTHGIIAALIVIIPLVIDLAYYLKTGESVLVDWETRISQLISLFETLRDVIYDVPIIGTIAEGVSLPGGGISSDITFDSDNGGFVLNDVEQDGERFRGSSPDSGFSRPTVSDDDVGGSGFPGTSQATGALTASIDVDASRSERELSKMIRREIDSMFNDFMKRDL